MLVGSYFSAACTALLVSARSVAVSELTSKIAVIDACPCCTTELIGLQVGRAGQVLFDRLHDVVAHLGHRRAVVLTPKSSPLAGRRPDKLLDDRDRREDAGERHQRDDHEDQGRPLDEEPGEAKLHCWNETFSPSPKLVCPFVTTRVPEGMPLTTEVVPSRADLGDLDRLYACRPLGPS